MEPCGLRNNWISLTFAASGLNTARHAHTMLIFISIPLHMAIWTTGADVESVLEGSEHPIKLCQTHKTDS